MFRLAAALVIPVLVLLGLELTLRAIGYGYPTAFFVRHPAAAPNSRVENYRFAWRFVPRTLARNPEPIVLAPDKPPGTCRIFVFGESAAIGDPAPAFGFSRILEVLLGARYPGTRFEVMNTAFTAINSHVVLPIARDCRTLHGDFWLVYMGNNEVIGPYGAGTVFGRQTPPQSVIHANLALKTTRTGQWLDALQQRLRPSREAAQGWGGMSMFLSQQVGRDDPHLDDVRRRFQQNLNAIVAAGTGAGARVLVSTVASRLRDWPPFGSLHRPDLADADRLQWEAAFAAGAAAEDARDFPAALQHYQSAARIDDTFAALHFRWGTCALALGQTAEARVHLTLARDLDTLRFRTDTRLNEAIRQTARNLAGTSVRLLDADLAFQDASTNGMPGEEFFHEHVHLTFAGNYLLARLFADELAALLPAAPASNAPPVAPWLPPETCAARLGYTDSQRYEIASLIRGRFDEPIYRQQLGADQRLKRLDRELASLRGYAKPVARRQALDVCRQALAARPDDRALHDLTARLLVALEDYPAAISEWREVARLAPHIARPHSEIGKLEQQQGRNDAALAAYSRALELNPDWPDAHVGLGNIYRAQGSNANAIRHYRRALSLDPTRTEAGAGLKNQAEPNQNPDR